MSDLDKKLLAILETIAVDVGEHITLPDLIDVENIKQAFIDAGFIEVPQSLKDTGETLIIMTQNQRRDVLNQSGYMTGQEWYDRFIAEFDKSVVSEHLLCGRVVCADHANEAAKKAAGIE